MSYINFKLLYEKGLTDHEYLLLQKVFQKEILLLEPFSDDLKPLFDRGLIQYLKGKENVLKAVRISKKGKEFLSQLSTMDYTDNIGEILDIIVDLYKSNDKHVGTKLEVKNRLVWFIAETGFSAKVIINSIEEYLSTNTEYTKSLENLLWTPASKAFSVHKNLKDSKLFDFICQKYSLDETFIVEHKGGKEMEWLSNVSRLSVPKKLNEELYFTGNMESDLEHVNKLKKLYFLKMKK